MSQIRKSLESGQQIAAPSNKDSEIHLPLLSKNQTSSASTFAPLPRLGSSKISHLSKSNFLGYETKTFEQKIAQKVRVIEKNDYQYVTTGEIHKEYSMLKQELKSMSEQLNRAISIKAFSKKVNGSASQKSTLSKSRFIDHSQQSQTIYEGFEKNNSKIFHNRSTELKTLMQNSGHILNHDPVELKQQLQSKISQTQESLLKEKRNNKQLVLESEKVGNEILNTDKMIEEMRALQNQLNILLLRKKKLQQQVEVNNIRSEKVKEGKANIFEKEYQLDQYRDIERKKISQNKSQTELNDEIAKKKRIIASLKKDKEARSKIKAKQYYDLLSQLNKIEENQQTINKKYDHLQNSLQKTTQQCLSMEQKFKAQMHRSSKSKLLAQISQNVQKPNGLQSSFYRSKRNLDNNEIQAKELLKQIEDSLSKTHKNLEEIEKKTSPKKSLQEAKSKSKKIEDQVSTFDDEKQNTLQESVPNSFKIKPENVIHKKSSNSKKYHELEDPEIPEQQQEDILDESTKRGQQKQFEDVYLTQNLEVDEEIQAL